MKHTVLTLAAHVKSEAGIHSVDISDLISEIKRSSLLEAEAREIELQNELSAIRTLKLKLSKI